MTYINRFAAITCLALGLLFTGNVQAEENSNYTNKSIAVIDLQALMQESKAADGIRSQVDKKRDAYQKDIEKIENSLKDKEEELKKAQKDLDEKAFMEKRREFEKKVVEAQRDIRQKRAVLERAFAEAMAKLRGEALKVIADISGERKIDVVLTRQQVVIVDSKMDITEPVLKKLNKDVKKVDVSFKEK